MVRVEHAGRVVSEWNVRMECPCLCLLHDPDLACVEHVESLICQYGILILVPASESIQTTS